MNFGRFLAMIVMALNLFTAVGYAVAFDWRRAIYWAAAAVITASVTF